MYVQESGRAGRDGELSCATILKNAADLNKQYTTQHNIILCCKLLHKQVWYLQKQDPF